MKNLNEQQSYISDTLNLLSGSKIEELDFDRLTAWLSDMAGILTEAARTMEEHNRLRQDYIGRTAGMLKAVAIAGRKRGSIQLALDQVEELDSMTATDLIKEYRRTQAKFKDTFGASFGLRPVSVNATPIKNPQDYK